MLGNNRGSIRDRTIILSIFIILGSILTSCNRLYGESHKTSSPNPTQLTSSDGTTLPNKTEKKVVEEFIFESDQFKLVGDLQLPGLDDVYPAVIFVHGSGASNRIDFGKYLPIMDRFLDSNYAVLSWDKPGVGQSTGSLAYDSTVIIQRANILIEALEQLKLHPSIDPGRIGVWGISQAGYVMPYALTITDEISFMIINSGPAMDAYDQSAYLLGQIVFCAGESYEIAKMIERQFSAAEKALSYQEYLEHIIPLSEYPVLAEKGFFRDIRSEDEWEPEDRERLGFFNPVEIIEKTTIPVLAIFGEKDRQVDPFQGEEAYKNAFQITGNEKSQTRLFLDADHNIVLSDTGCLEERDQRSSSEWLNYAPGYLELMEEWLNQLSKD